MTPTTPVISVFFPAFNEEKNIEGLIADALVHLRRLAIPFEIIVVNDGSRDHTASVVQTLQKKIPELILISHATNRGYGAALATGFLRSRGDMVFFTDADRQFSLVDLPPALSALKQADAVIGYRSPRRDPLLRRVAGRTWTILINQLFHLSFRDIDCAFKLFKKSALQILDPNTLTMTGAMISAEILVRLSQSKLTIVEIPVTHYSRQEGSSSGIRPSVVWRALSELIFFRLSRK